MGTAKETNESKKELSTKKRELEKSKRRISELNGIFKSSMRTECRASC